MKRSRIRNECTKKKQRTRPRNKTRTNVQVAFDLEYMAVFGNCGKNFKLADGGSKSTAGLVAISGSGNQTTHLEPPGCARYHHAYVIVFQLAKSSSCGPTSTLGPYLSTVLPPNKFSCSFICRCLGGPQRGEDGKIETWCKHLINEFQGWKAALKQGTVPALMWYFTRYQYWPPSSHSHCSGVAAMATTSCCSTS